jgi:hypothetical protein
MTPSRRARDHKTGEWAALTPVSPVRGVGPLAIANTQPHVCQARVLISINPRPHGCDAASSKHKSLKISHGCNNNYETRTSLTLRHSSVSLLWCSG